jgi:gliding motility-associated-like protein
MATTLDGSAPLDINFDAISNNATDFVRWDIYYNNELFLNRTDQTHRFTFSKAGTYQVKLKAENAYCNYVDSITVKVSESALYAPNVFSPNGDDVNDEFRFAFKSIVSFQCTIFNRSGKQIYSWTDPLKGWDGTYNGVPVPEGAYFYIATAKGSDNKEYKLKGDINLLRGKKK